LNHILKQKLSITSRKPQTTRHQILGIKTEGDVQAIYVDTPGLHRNNKNAMNRYMNKAAFSVVHDVDVVIFVVAEYWTQEDDWILDRLKTLSCPVILAINKVDKVKDKSELLPLIEQVAQKLKFMEVVPISAQNNVNLDGLEKVVEKCLPYNPFFYDPDQITDRSERFIAAEIIREKLIRNLGQELPYSLTVEINQFKQDPKTGMVDIAATIFVERDSQKAIVIGKGGSKLKQVGHDARVDLEAMLSQKVFLQLWVKVREGWSDDERALRSLGYD
jgi:GTP-binding protein Era